MYKQLRQSEWRWLRLAIALAAVSLLLVPSLSETKVTAQDDPESVKVAVARFIRLNSPLGDQGAGVVRSTALKLKEIARTEERETFLIIEISPGISEFHHAYALAELLTSETLNGVRTVAWVPESVTGNNALVALACNEIVMHPDAELGDIGRGKAVSNDQQTIVKGIIAKRRNARVNGALVTAMMNPETALLQLTIDKGDGAKETRLATVAEAKSLRDQAVVISDSKTIKEAGIPGIFSGAESRANDMLVSQTATDSRELVENYGLPLESLREVAQSEEVVKVAYIKLHDEINQLFTTFANRQIDRAIQSRAKLIIFEIDSPGGELFGSRDLAFKIAGLNDSGIKTVAYVPNEAVSGGTIIALGCDEIYLTPEATIGDAIPIRFREGQFVAADGKILSIETKFLRELADLKNRPPAIVEAIADVNLEVFRVTHSKTGRVWYMSEDEIHAAGDEWVKGPRVGESRPGVAITVDGHRAHELKLAASPVTDLDELKGRLGVPLDMKLKSIERTWVDSLVFFLNNSFVVGFLFFIAIVCIYLELSTMTGVFGIIAAVAFGIFFWSQMLGGTATYLEVVLFIIGVGCLLMEFYVVPGFGVFGVTGILLVLAALIMASQTFTGFDINYDASKAGKTILTFGTAVLGVIAIATAISAYLPHIPILRNIILAAPGTEVAGVGPKLRPEHVDTQAALVGKAGTTMTVLRPAGKARIDGELLDVVSAGAFIEPEVEVTVVSVTGNRIVVQEV